MAVQLPAEYNAARLQRCIDTKFEGNEAIFQGRLEAAGAIVLQCKTHVDTLKEQVELTLTPQIAVALKDLNDRMAERIVEINRTQGVVE